MNQENRKFKKISPDELMEIMALSPAENSEGFDTVVHWKSLYTGGLVRQMFEFRDILEEIAKHPEDLGPFSICANFYKELFTNFCLEPIKFQAQGAVRSSRDPDPFIEQNIWIETSYAGAIKDLCAHVMGKETGSVLKRPMPSQEPKKGTFFCKKEYLSSHGSNISTIPTVFRL